MKATEPEQSHLRLECKPSLSDVLCFQCHKNFSFSYLISEGGGNAPSYFYFLLKRSNKEKNCCKNQGSAKVQLFKGKEVRHLLSYLFLIL